MDGVLFPLVVVVVVVLDHFLPHSNWYLAWLMSIKLFWYYVETNIFHRFVGRFYCRGGMPEIWFNNLTESFLIFGQMESGWVITIASEYKHIGEWSGLTSICDEHGWILVRLCLRHRSIDGHVNEFKMKMHFSHDNPWQNCVWIKRTDRVEGANECDSIQIDEVF